MDTNIKLSTLWVVVLFNMAFADIFTFMLEYSTGQKPEFEATQELMLIAAFILEIPIAMIFLSRVFKHSLNRWKNIIAAIITAVLIIAGGSSYYHYLFFAMAELICLSLIIWYAWKYS